MLSKTQATEIEPASLELSKGQKKILPTRANPVHPQGNELTGKILNKDLEMEEPDTKSWGWFPVLSLSGGFGIFLVGLGDTIARDNSPWAENFFWVGLLFFLVPVAVRVSIYRVSQREAAGIIALEALGLYMVKVLHSPAGYTFFDEFLHYRTTSDILNSGHLFSPNPLLPVSPLFPGLEIATTALVNLTGLSIFHAGIVLIGAARLVMSLGLFILFKSFTNSVRIGLLSTLFYSANSNFVFFDAQFSYESLALPLMIFSLVALQRRSKDAKQANFKQGLAVLAGVVALVLTHHVTSYLFAAILSLWFLVTLWLNRKGYPAKGPGWFPLITFGICISWLIIEASPTIVYISPLVTDTVGGFLNFLSGQGSPRKLFQSGNGQGLPLEEQVLVYVSIIIILAALVYGLFFLWRVKLRNSLLITLILIAVCYPVTLGLRLLGPASAWQISNRSSAYIFIGLGFILTLFLGRLHTTKHKLYISAATVVIFITLVFSGIISGWSASARLPWPYLPGADVRSVEPQSVETATWTLENLGPDNRFIADRFNGQLLESYGQQHVVNELADKVSISGIFLSPTIGPDQLTIIKQAKIGYILVDMRLTQVKNPLAGYFFESWEQQVAHFKTPIDPGLLTKFDLLPYFERVYQSKDISIYKVKDEVFNQS